MKARIVVCASGEGTNFEAIVRATRAGTLSADVIGVISNRAQAGVVRRALNLGIPSAIIPAKSYTSPELWDAAMVEQLFRWRAEWVVLAGFLLRIGARLLQAYPDRIVNSHPALLPKYGGSGMYGERVHSAVIQAGETETGVTIHRIDAHYDQGQILAQKKIPVRVGDTPETLAARVKHVEAEFYPQVLNDLLSGRLTIS